MLEIARLTNMKMKSLAYYLQVKLANPHNKMIVSYRLKPL